jgi:hypothetical protein
MNSGKTMSDFISCCKKWGFRYWAVSLSNDVVPVAPPVHQEVQLHAGVGQATEQLIKKDAWPIAADIAAKVSCLQEWPK